ncbi:YtxH domain-containing protein [Candidatus Dojkabacteria bacterium]|jgi:gas vesicle protein|nr:YtxH domain-containing protein [Candidatus Dojkabacteria bacterium]
MSENHTGSFLKGILMGAIAGAVAGVLLAPKAGSETRKDLEKLAKQWAAKAGDIYEEAMEKVNEKLLALKSLGKKIDEQKYLTLVNEVIAELKNDGKVTSDVAHKMGLQLKRDWKKVQVALTDKN